MALVYQQSREGETRDDIDIGMRPQALPITT
jgi:hypothetical protein